MSRSLEGTDSCFFLGERSENAPLERDNDRETTLVALQCRPSHAGQLVKRVDGLMEAH